MSELVGNRFTDQCLVIHTASYHPKNRFVDLLRWDTRTDRLTPLLDKIMFDKIHIISKDYIAIEMNINRMKDVIIYHLNRGKNEFNYRIPNCSPYSVITSDGRLFLPLELTESGVTYSIIDPKNDTEEEINFPGYLLAYQNQNYFYSTLGKIYLYFKGRTIECPSTALQVGFHPNGIPWFLNNGNLFIWKALKFEQIIQKCVFETQRDAHICSCSSLGNDLIYCTIAVSIYRHGKSAHFYLYDFQANKSMCLFYINYEGDTSVGSLIPADSSLNYSFNAILLGVKNGRSIEQLHTAVLGSKSLGDNYNTIGFIPTSPQNKSKVFGELKAQLPQVLANLITNYLYY